MQVLFTPSARAQLLSAIKAIRRHSQIAARKFRTQAERSLKRLSRFPQSGAVILEFPDLPYREIDIKPYRFFYRVREDTVWIVALWHGAQYPTNPRTRSSGSGERLSQESHSAGVINDHLDRVSRRVPPREL